MIDQQLKDHVTTQVEAVKSAQGTYTDVVRRGRARKRASLGLQAAAAILVVFGVAAIATQLPDSQVADAPVIDLEITVNQGDGPGPFADELAEFAGPPVENGSAQHIGRVETPHGQFDLITYTIGTFPEGQEPSGPDYVTCTGGTFIGASSSDLQFAVGRECDPSGEIPPLSGGFGRGDGGSGTDAFYYVLERTPANTHRVILTTTDDKRIQVVSSSEYMFAAWPATWGPPVSLTAHNPEGAQTGSISYTE